MNAGLCIVKKQNFYKNRHLWIFSGAIKTVKDALPGGIVDVVSVDGKFLGRGYYNPGSDIRVRMLSFRKERIDREFFKKRIINANLLRERFLENTNVYRVVYSDSDLLPGLIVDRYADYLVVQFQTLGMDKMKHMIIDALNQIFKPEGIYERNDVQVRSREKLPLLRGTISGKEPPDLVQVQENGVKFLVDVKRGHKTGFYIDQRENRKKVRELSPSRVLNLYSYTGGFGVYACLGGGEVVNVDTSKEALELAKENFKLNGIPSHKHREVLAKAEDVMRERWNGDMIILDPPNLALKRKNREQGIKKFTSLNANAIHSLGQGLLFTFSCSGNIHTEDFKRAIFHSGQKIGKELVLLELTGHPFDHPVRVYSPELEYLKGALLYVR